MTKIEVFFFFQKSCQLASYPLAVKIINIYNMIPVRSPVRLVYMNDIASISSKNYEQLFQ